MWSQLVLLRALSMSNGCLGSAKQSWFRSKLNGIGSFLLEMSLLNQRK